MGTMNQKDMSQFALLWRTGDLKTVEDVRNRVLTLVNFLENKELAAINLREFNKRYGPILSRLKITMMDIAEQFVNEDKIYLVMRDNRMWLISRAFEKDLIEGNGYPPIPVQIDNMVNMLIYNGTKFFGLTTKARKPDKEEKDDFSFSNYE